MAPQAPTRKRQGGSGSAAPAGQIPDKLYFRIGEVATLCGVPAYVLRFWEGEFTQLKPNKGGTGQRLYRRRDVEMALKVKSLLYDEGYTIAGARLAFKTEARSGAAKTAAAQEPAASSATDLAPVRDLTALETLRNDLRELHALLLKPAAASKAGPPRSAVQPIRASRPLRPEAVAAVPLPPPTPFARPRLISSTRPAPKPPEPGLFDAAGLFTDLEFTDLETTE